jgi:hypothetical protein
VLIGFANGLNRQEDSGNVGWEKLHGAAYEAAGNCRICRQWQMRTVLFDRRDRQDSDPRGDSR